MRARKSVLLASLVGLGSALRWPSSAPAGQATVDIRYRDTSGAATVGPVGVSVIAVPGRCEYHLEFNDPDQTTPWAIGEVAGDQGPPQRYVNATCTPPQFIAGPKDSVRQFEEQTAYYWVKRARDY